MDLIFYVYTIPDIHPHFNLILFPISTSFSINQCELILYLLPIVAPEKKSYTLKLSTIDQDYALS